MRHVVFLRAVNVGGHSIIPMSELAALFEAAGCGGVRTYIQTGNVIFDAAPRAVPGLMKKAAALLEKRLARKPSLIVKTVDDLQRMIQSAPFGQRKEDAGTKLYVTLLASAPKKKLAVPLVSEKEAAEIVGMAGLDVFVVSRRKKDGMFGFPNAVAEKELGVAATTRNWNTIVKIVEFAGKKK